jgi:glutamine synthetase
MLKSKILSDFGLYAVTASEIEFYLFGSHGCDLTEFWNELKTCCTLADIALFNIEKERGYEQHEVSLAPCRNPEKIVSDTNALKSIISDLATKYSMQADFSAKPLIDDFGSGLHIHIHLENETGKNLFFKDDENISHTLNHSIGGLLLWLPDTMPIFAPNEVSYARFVSGGNAPTTVSWGANNRTVAIRLPDAKHDNKRIEHRVSGADADIEQVMQVILAAIHHGLTIHAKPPVQIYGDAALAMYNLPSFPNSLQEAVVTMQQSELPFREYGVLIES